MLIAQLYQNGIIWSRLYNELVEISYEHACFQILCYLHEQWYFSQDEQTSSKVENLVVFYRSNFHSIHSSSIQDTQDSTKKNAFTIVQENSSDWLLWEINDLIDLGNQFMNHRNIPPKVPQYVFSIPQRLFQQNIIRAADLNSINNKIKNSDNFLGIIWVLVFEAFSSGRLDTQAEIHQSAYHFLTKLSWYIHPSNRKNVLKVIDTIMRNFQAREEESMKKQEREKVFWKIIEILLHTSEKISIHISLVYHFLQNLEDIWYISWYQHQEILEQGNIKKMMCLGILEALQCGELWDNPPQLYRVISALQIYFTQEQMEEENEILSSLHNDLF